LTAQINADKLKHNERLLPIVVQQKTPNVPGSGVRILRQQPSGYQYQVPTPSFFLPTQASNQSKIPSILLHIFSSYNLIIIFRVTSIESVCSRD
jgi:hypothetical protein